MEAATGIKAASSADGMLVKRVSDLLTRVDPNFSLSVAVDRLRSDVPLTTPADPLLAIQHQNGLPGTGPR